MPGEKGVIYGGIALLGKQLVAVLACFGASFGITGVLAVGLHTTIGLRVTAEEEALGLDQAHHHELAYAHTHEAPMHGRYSSYRRSGRSMIQPSPARSPDGKAGNAVELTRAPTQTAPQPAGDVL